MVSWSDAFVQTPICVLICDMRITRSSWAQGDCHPVPPQATKQRGHPGAIGAVCGRDFAVAKPPPGRRVLDTEGTFSAAAGGGASSSLSCFRARLLSLTMLWGTLKWCKQALQTSRGLPGSNTSRRMSGELKHLIDRLNGQQCLGCLRIGR